MVCHDPPWLPILRQSHEVFVSHSRPFFIFVIYSDCGCRPTKVGYFPFLMAGITQSCSYVIFRLSSFVLFSIQDIFIIFRCAHISNDCIGLTLIYRIFRHNMKITEQRMSMRNNCCTVINIIGPYLFSSRELNKGRMSAKRAVDHFHACGNGTTDRGLVL